VSEDIRTAPLLVCAILALVIAVSTRAARRLRPVHSAFFALSIDVSAWYFWQSTYALTGAVPSAPAGWALIRAGIVCAAALPYLAHRLFDAMLAPDPPRGSRRLGRVVLVATVMSVLVMVAVGPDHLWVRVLLFGNMVACLGAVLVSLYRHSKLSPRRLFRRRASYPFILGAAACVATVADCFSLVWEPSRQAPPFGAVLSVAFLFALREAIHSERLPGMWELVGRVGVAILLGFVIFLISQVLSKVLGARFHPTYVDLVLGITVCSLFDTIRAQLEAQTRWLRFFIEPSGLEASADLLGRRLLHVLTTEEMSVIVMDTLHASRRLTGAGLFLRDPDDTGFERIATLGSPMPSRIEVTTARPLLDRLSTGPLSLDEIEREVRARRDAGVAAEPRDEAVLTAATVLGGSRSRVVAGIRDEAGDLVGLLVMVDERAGGAFSLEETLAIGKIAGQMGVVIESSRAYAEMKQHDRLAVIGQMTAGLAHEIRNPLGSIRGAAQLLVRLGSDPGGAEEASKFLGVIVEEVDRLARVLDSVLDLAPQKPTVAPIDVNAVVRRTLQVLSAEPGHEDLEVRETLDPGLPRVEIDPEQLQQVLLNLLRNSAQATEGRGKVAVSTAVRVTRTSWKGAPRLPDSLVELKVTDNGPGISRKVIEKLFVPFFTTKKKGTGLGLAVSQKIVQEARGRIEVRSHEGEGTSFVVLLPAAMDALGTPTPRPTAAST
jgi:two-component system, NtrC family, sensor histidine kinase HydH